MLDLIIFTQGLPDGTFRNKRYEFHFLGDYIYIPGDYVGKDQIGNPHHLEQENYLNSLKKEGVEPVWDGEWKFTKGEFAHSLHAQLQAIENFKGEYHMRSYHRNDDPSAVFKLNIGNEAIIQKVSLQETHYQIVSGEITSNQIREYVIKRQLYQADTGKLILYTQENNLQEIAFEVNITDYTFEQTYLIKNQ